MKMKIIIISIIILILIITIFFVLNKNNNKITDIEYFNFHYTTGYHMNAYVIYNLEHKNNKYIASIKPNEIPDENAIKKEVDKSFVNNLKKILIKYQVETWNGFKKYDKNVLDGNSFSLNVRMQNSEIESSGYMKWPKNYTEVKQELDKLFSKIYKQNN